MTSTRPFGRSARVLAVVVLAALAVGGPVPEQAQAACTAAAVAPAEAETAGRIDLFARGTDNALWQRYWDLGNPWTCWQTLRGDLASAPAAASHDDQVVHLSALGPDGRIKDRAYVNNQMLLGGWSMWGDLGTETFASAPAAASWGTGHYEVFALDQNKHLKHNWYRFSEQRWSGWYGWPNDTMELQGAPAAAAYAKDRLHVFARGLDNRMYQRFLTAPGVWSGWVPMGDKEFTSSPGAVSWGPTHLEVFALGADSKVWHSWFDFTAKAWTTWYVLDGAQTFKEAPAAASWAPGRLNLFALGTDNRMWQRHLTDQPGVWSAWAPMGDEQFTSGPAAASWTRQVNQ
ncbi:hypothetical protein [Kribbella albertanoniae]|uniref:PLL-like beta propeller domain-containing protein n=1 Tax=Kribbella albertanoniae TaxID=1266829 RepID=A0A4R4PSI2_9ACTN|nr:hypothetical protein [Kribbella albertanoniae]TDC25258.1 hypothetical protein E1261_24585 [Kribbella albertanoniae]